MIKAHFEYHCWEDERSQDAILWHHTGQDVEIVRPLTDQEADNEEIGQMYKVRFLDSLEYEVFNDEVTLFRNNHGRFVPRTKYK